MALNIALRTQAYLPWLEPVSYTVAASNSADELMATLTKAAQYSLSLREQAASNGAYQAGDVVWTLDKAEADAAGVTPKPRDRVTDQNGTVYTVLSRADTSVLGFYKATTRALAVAYALRDLVTIQVAAIGRGVTGARANVDWVDKYVSLPARVQPQAVETFTERGKKSARVQYRVYVDRQIDPRDPDGNWGRVRWGSQYLEIRDYKDAERIDELPYLDAEAVP
jgi:hypothetical protein